MEWEATNSTSKSDWVKFVRGPIWKAILFDIADRETFLIHCFKEGDKEWSPEILRGKLTELDYIRNIPALIVASIEELKKKEEEKQDE